jgi:hypothetical protein
MPSDFLENLRRSCQTEFEVDLIPQRLEVLCKMLDTLTLPSPVTIGGADLPIGLMADEHMKHTNTVGASSILARSSQDSNIFRKPATDGAGHLRYSYPDARMKEVSCMLWDTCVLHMGF